MVRTDVPGPPPTSARAPAAAQEGPEAAGLVAAALALGARPRLRLRLQETDDPEADLRRARPIFRLLQQHPGSEAVVVEIRHPNGAKTLVLFRCRLDRQALAALSQLMRAVGQRPPPPHPSLDRR